MKETLEPVAKLTDLQLKNFEISEIDGSAIKRIRAQINFTLGGQQSYVIVDAPMWRIQNKTIKDVQDAIAEFLSLLVQNL